MFLGLCPKNRVNIIDLPIQSRVEGKYPIFAASGFSGGHQEFRVKSPGVVR